MTMDEPHEGYFRRPGESLVAAARRVAVDAVYHARDTGGTMHDAGERAADMVLALLGPARVHYVDIDDDGFTVTHPLTERFEGTMHLCSLHADLRDQDEAPAPPGRYVATEDGESWHLSPAQAAASFAVVDEEFIHAGPEVYALRPGARRKHHQIPQEGDEATTAEEARGCPDPRPGSRAQDQDGSVGRAAGALLTGQRQDGTSQVPASREESRAEHGGAGSAQCPKCRGRGGLDDRGDATVNEDGTPRGTFAVVGCDRCGGSGVVRDGSPAEGS